MSNVLNLLSEQTFIEKMDNQNTLLAAIASNGGGVKITSWSAVQQVVRLGLASKIFAVGDQFVSTKGDAQLKWDIIGFDNDIPADSQFKHSMTIQLHDCYNTAVFDATEALYYCAEELPAGTYNFTLLPNYDTTYGGGKTYQFTLTNSVPAGGQIMFPWAYNKQASTVKITTYSSNKSNADIEEVSVTEGNGGTNLGTADGSTTNMNHTHKIRYGSNRWLHSAIRQWLNSDKAGSAWWSPQNNFDRPPNYTATAGFLNGMDSEFLSVIGKVNKKTARNTITDGGGYDSTEELMFLLSRSEVYSGLENNINEGDPYFYYSNYSSLSAAGTAADTNRIKYKNGAVQYWWLRSPNYGYSGSVRVVGTGGRLGSGYAYGGGGVAPACCII